MSATDLKAAGTTRDEVDSPYTLDTANIIPPNKTDFTSLSPDIDPPYTPCTYQSLSTDEVTSLQSQLQDADDDPAASEIREHLQEELAYEWQSLINRALGKLHSCMTCSVCNEPPGVNFNHQMTAAAQDSWEALQMLDIQDVDDLYQDPGEWLGKMTAKFQVVEMAYREGAFKVGCSTLADHGHGVH